MSVSLDPRIKESLKKLKKDWEEKFGRAVTWSEVLQRLHDTYVKYEKLKNEIKRLRGIIEEVAKKPINLSGGMVSSQPVQPSPVPQFKPPPSFSKHKPLLKMETGNSGRELGNTGTQAQLMAEMRERFSKGVKLKSAREEMVREIAEAAGLARDTILFFENENGNVEIKKEMLEQLPILVRIVERVREMEFIVTRSDEF